MITSLPLWRHQGGTKIHFCHVLKSVHIHFYWLIIVTMTKKCVFQEIRRVFFLIRRPFWKYSVIRDCRGSHFGNIVFYRAMLCIRGTIAMALCPFVCLSIRLSVTSRSSTKTAKQRITQTTPHDSPGTLVFWCQRSPQNSTGVTPYEGAECRWGGSKSATFD